ncbi:type II toxin-antitoxin system VapC family toxin [Candidatus Palauibacter sp.]|uniref:type II toxin-antitoxin system VapC family toxin n=1 Tax=Candidatus Palauibacter sp. TaxID=3101350 RepID=UPI003C6FC426
MKALFVDTSAWYPLADPGHPEHGAVAAALRVRVREGAAVVTTNLVVVETHALLLSRKGRRAAFAFLEAIRQPPNRIEYVGSERETVAIDRWIRRFADQSFSLADAASFEVMTELGIEEALTLDRHFNTAGFLMVPGGV